VGFGSTSCTTLAAHKKMPFLSSTDVLYTAAIADYLLLINTSPFLSISCAQGALAALPEWAVEVPAACKAFGCL
jgi:hypothetical protein